MIWQHTPYGDLPFINVTHNQEVLQKAPKKDSEPETKFVTEDMIPVSKKIKYSISQNQYVEVKEVCEDGTLCCTILSKDQSSSQTEIYTPKQLSDTIKVFFLIECGEERSVAEVEV